MVWQGVCLALDTPAGGGLCTSPRFLGNRNGPKGAPGWLDRRSERATLDLGVAIWSPMLGAET